LSTGSEPVEPGEAVSVAEPSVARRGARLVLRSMRAHPIPHAVGILAGNVFVAGEPDAVIPGTSK